MIAPVKFLDRSVISYLDARLKSGDPEQTKEALQDLCSWYRKGYRIRVDQWMGILNEIIGLLFSTSDAKVQRWGLNALALIGREKQCKGAILHCIGDHRDDPEIVAAGIAAIYNLSSKPEADLTQLQFDPQMIVLSALQHVSADTLDLSPLPLRVEKADPEYLKLGLIVIGLDKAPPNLFEPNFSNSQMIAAIGKHHNPIVSQYAVWAATESSQLTIDDIGFRPSEYEIQPENVRSWIYQLIGHSAPAANRLIEYCKHCMDEEVPAVRAGLAEGLKETFSIQLEPLVVDWFTKEYDQKTRLFILDHFIRQSTKSDLYKSYALDAYEREGANSLNRGRMEAMAIGTPLFSLYTQIRYDGNPDLFRGATYVAGNQVNVQHVQGGAVSLTGNASNTGSTYNTLTATVNNQIKDCLSGAAREIKKSDVDNTLKEETLQKILHAQAEPTADKLTKAAQALESFEKVASSTLGSATTLAPLIADFFKLIGLG